MSIASLPSWLPANACDIREEVAQEALCKLQRCPVHVPLLQRSVHTAYLTTAVDDGSAGSRALTVAWPRLRNTCTSYEGKDLSS